MYTSRISELEKIVKEQREELAVNDQLISSLRSQLATGSTTLVWIFNCSSICLTCTLYTVLYSFIIGTNIVIRSILRFVYIEFLIEHTKLCRWRLRRRRLMWCVNIQVRAPAVEQQTSMEL